MKEKKKLLVCTVLGMLSLMSCGDSERPFERMIPADASMALIAPDIASLLADVDEFARVSGMTGLTNGMTIKELVFSRIDLDETKAFEMLDLTKPSGAYLIGSLTEDPSITILLAVKDAVRASEWIVATFGPSFAVDGPRRGYIAVRPAAQAAHDWSPSRPIKSGALASRGERGLILGINYRSLLSDPAGASADVPDMAESLRDLSSALGWASIRIGADAKAISMRLSMSVTKGSAYGKLLRHIHGEAPTFAARMSADEIFGIATNVRVEDASLADGYLKAMLPVLGMDRMENSLRAYLSLGMACGGDSYVFMDAAPAGPVTAIAELGKLSLRAGGVIGVNDLVGFKENLVPALEGILTLNSERLLAVIGRNNAPGLAARVEVREPPAAMTHGRAGSSGAYDAYGVSFRSGGVLSQSEETALGGLFDSVMCYNDSRVAFGIGTDNVSVMESFEAGAIPSIPLSDLPGYADVAARVDPEANMVGHLALSRLGNALGVALGLPLSFNERVPGLVFSYGVGPDSISFDAALGAAEFGTYFLSVLPMLVSR